MPRGAFLRSALITLVASALGCARAEGEALPDAVRPEPAHSTPAPVIAPAAQGAVEHALIADQALSLHRFRIALERARFSLVELGYTRAVSEALGDHALVFNGGYWAYRGAARVIQGLLVVEGTAHAPLAGSAGGVMLVEGGHARMLKSAELRDPVSQAALAIQCSPRLVVAGAVVPKLDPLRRAPRTALCVAADPRVLEVYVTDDGVRPTLRAFAEALTRAGCRDALNLDGGPSTGAALARPSEPLRVGLGAPVPYAIAVDARWAERP